MAGASGASPGVPRLGSSSYHVAAMFEEARPLIREEGHKLPMRDRVLLMGAQRLAEHSQKKSEATEDDGLNTAELAARVALLAGGPTALFVILLIVVVWFYHDWPFWVFLTFTLTVVKSYLIANLVIAKRWLHWLGPLLGVGACAGMLAGLYVYYGHLVYYYSYQGLDRHFNVPPSANALAYEDSGMLVFPEDTRVDMTRAVGYQSPEAGAKLCIAPVVDAVMAPTDPVNFFAIGVDCCDWRADFGCDDANKADAHSAVLHLELSRIVTPLMAWATEDTKLHDGFQAALRMDQAAFNLVLANSTRFLRFARDPDAMQKAYWEDALRESGIWLGLFLVAIVVTASFAASGRHKVKGAALRSATALEDGSLPHGEPFRVGHRPGRKRHEGYQFVRWL